MTKKYTRTDARALNDIDGVDDTTKAYHDMTAQREAQRLADRYKNSPAYLRLLSLHLGEMSQQSYSKHLQQLEKDHKPRNPQGERDGE